MIGKSGWRRLHLWLAIIASLPLVILSVTGALLVFPAETEALFTRADLSVIPIGEILKPSQIIVAVESKFPDDDKVTRLRYPKQRTHPMEIDTRDHRVLVDPYSGTVLASSDARSGFMQVVLSLHVNLIWGEIGTWITGTSALILMLLCVSGLWLWRPIGRWKCDYFKIRFRSGPKRLNFDLHRVTGFYVSLILFAIALTGATMVFWDVMTPPVYWLTGSTKKPEGSEIKVEPSELQKLSPDEILKMAMDKYPGREPRRLYLSSSPTKPYRVFLDPPGEHELRVNEVRIEINPYTGAILQSEGPDSMSRADTILRWVLPVHFGTFGGYWVKVIYLFASLSPVVLSVTGTLLWYRRHQNRALATAKRTTNPVKELLVST